MQESHMYKMYKRFLNIKFVIFIIGFLCLISSFIFPENRSLLTISATIFYLDFIVFSYLSGWLDGYRKFENEEEK